MRWLVRAYIFRSREGKGREILQGGEFLLPGLGELRSKSVPKEQESSPGII